MPVLKVWDGTAWVPVSAPVASTPEVIPLTLHSTAFTTGWTGSVHYQKYGTVVTVWLSAAKTSWGTNETITTVPLPEGIRPISTHSAPVMQGANSSGASEPRSWWIDTSTGHVRAAGGSTGNIQGSITYQIAASASGGSGGGGASSSLLGVKSYNPGTQVNYTTTATTATDLDATNLALTFTAPSSGSVLVRLTALMTQLTAGKGAYWHLRSGSTTVASRFVFTWYSGVTHDLPATAAFHITGLTPGTSYTYKWAQSTDTGGDARVYAGGIVGPAVMEVYDAVPTSGSGGGGTSGYTTSITPALTAHTWSTSINHALNITGMAVSAYEVATGEDMDLDWKRIDANNVQLRAGVAMAANSYVLYVTGR